MLKKISTADARKKLSNIVNRVAFGKESFVLTRHGKPLAAIVSIEGLRLLQEPGGQVKITDARKRRSGPGEDVTLEQLQDDLSRSS